MASQVLAHPDSQVLGLIGAGAQAVTQLHALSRVFDLKEILVFDTDPQAARSFSDRVDFLDLPRLSIRTPALSEVVAHSDIICTATSVEIGEGPVFDDGDIQSHVHINAVGSDFPGKTEIPKSLLERSLVCPDFLKQAMKEGECQRLRTEQIGPDLVELTKYPEKYAAYREQLTVFDSTGWALEDHVMMDILVNHARKIGCGSLVQIENVSRDPKDPYAFLSDDAESDSPMADAENPCQLYVID